MSELMPYAWTLGPVLDVLSEWGMSQKSRRKLFAGLSFPPNSVNQLSSRVSWDDYASVLDRIHEVIGGAEQWEPLIQVAFPRANGLLTSLAGRIANVRLLYLAGTKLTGPRLWPMTRGLHEDLPDGKIGQTIEILGGYRDSEPFFLFMRGILVASPSLLGLPPAQVRMERRPGIARYTIEPGVPADLSKNLSRWNSDVIDRGDLRKVLEFVQGVPAWRPTAPRSPFDEARESELERPTDAAFLESVEAALSEAFSRRQATSEFVASQMSISSRTLARRLAESGTSFRAVRDWVRRDIAIRRLVAEDSIGEIAYDLGFADRSSFHRAFKRWTGYTPAEFQIRNGFDSRTR